MLYLPCGEAATNLKNAWGAKNKSNAQKIKLK